MRYEEKWSVLADLLIELQRKGEEIPVKVINDLRSAKTMIQVVKADPTHIENISRLDTYLRNVESYAILTMEKQGKGSVEDWLKKLKASKILPVKEKGNETSRFIPGIPRNKSWVRVQVSDETPLKEVKKIVKEKKLSHKTLGNGYILVYGDEENVKSFVKGLAEQFRGSRNR